MNEPPSNSTVQRKKRADKSKHLLHTGIEKDASNSFFHRESDAPELLLEREQARAMAEEIRLKKEKAKNKLELTRRRPKPRKRPPA